MQMQAGIELEQLSDRDLLVLAVHSVNDIKSTLVNQDKRIRDLENWRWLISGGVGVLVFLVSIFGAVTLSKL